MTHRSSAPDGRCCTFRWALLLSLLVFLSACQEKKAPPPPPPPKVTVAQPVQRVVTDYLELNGTSQAVRTVQLVARVSGYLDKVLFRDGQMVRKGEPLFLIQQDTYLARLQQAEGQILQQTAQLEYAQKQLDRFSGMLQLKASSQADVDNWRFQRDGAQAGLKAARAQRDLARLDLEYTRVNAPFGGRIDRRLKDPGNLVGAGENTLLAELSQVDPLYVYFTISDLDLARLKKGARGLPGQGGGDKLPVAVGLADQEGYPLQGHLDFAATSISPTTGTLLLRGVVANPTGRLLPGLHARVRVPLARKQALLVPEVAVASDQQGAYLLVVNDKNLVERRSVRTGALVEQLRVIEDGLKESEWVVVNGLLRAAPGRPVTPERAPLPAAQVKP